MSPHPDPNSGIRYVALYLTGIVAVLGMLTFCWCAIWKIYIDVPMLLVLSNITIAAVSSFTTLLTGRTVAQLNQQSDVRNQPQIATLESTQP